MNDKFDIEKWRCEYPMDYLKAMDLINLSTNKNEVFMDIYKVTRLHIPEVLYKYYSLTNDISLNEQKLETLLSKRIYLSDVCYLNDPFDGKAFFYRPEELKRFERLARHNGRLIDDFTAFVKVAALTSNGISAMPMWAHYSNNHNGYCLSYAMKRTENCQLSGCTFPVQYTDVRIDVTSLMVFQSEKMITALERQISQGKKEIMLDDLSLIFMEALFCNIKHKSWSYENEFRCTIGKIAEGAPYVSATPSEIYIGMKCEETYREKLVRIANSLGVPAFEMVFKENGMQFDLLPNRLN